MTFSTTVKEELTGVTGNARHCIIAELAAIWHFADKKRNEDGGIYLEFDTPEAARKVFTLLKKAFNIIVDFSVNDKKRSKGGKYFVGIADKADAAKLERAFDRRKILSMDCCRRAYLRGAFLVAGTVVDPERYYRLEFVLANEKDAGNITDVLDMLGIKAKTVKRGDVQIVYLNEGEQISYLLGLMEANKALLAFENVRVTKEVRGKIQRRVNCETSNLNKTIKASYKQMDDINYIKTTAGFASLPDHLAQMARLRLEYPEASLSELGELTSPKVGRSGVNHRLRKLSEIAESLRSQGM